MADDTLTKDGDLNPQQLIAELRNQEDLFFRVTEMRIDAASGKNEFDLNVSDDLPDATESLQIQTFAEATDAEKQAIVKKDFVDFGGNIVSDGVIKIGGASVYTILFRGQLPELPSPHAASPASPLPPSIPEHARSLFSEGGPLAGVPWDQAQTLPVDLKGMRDGNVMAFKNSSTGKIEAFIMITDADIDTDGPIAEGEVGGQHIDPNYDDETKLNFSDGSSCNSREFPGVVRSVRLRDLPLDLRMGDFAYICFNGKAVACQIYDQGDDDKIGEISIFAARQVGGIPPNPAQSEEIERRAATKGNFTKELVTLCFPRSSAKNRAVPNAQIEAGAKQALDAFVKAAPKFSMPKPPVLAPAQVGTFRIFQRSTWGALPPKVSSFAPATALGIVLHNTEDPNRQPGATEQQEIDAAFERSRSIQKSHFKRQFSDVGQHFTISRGGIIMEGRAGTLDATTHKQVVRGAHAGVTLFNNQWWGIELEGDYRVPGERPPAAQQAALITLCTWLASLIAGFDPTQNVRVHRQVKPGGTDCPGHLLDPNNLPDFLSTVRTNLQAVGPGVAAPTIV